METVWETVNKDLPVLKGDISKVLSGIKVKENQIDYSLELDQLIQEKIKESNDSN